jgi:hypothetical protein
MADLGKLAFYGGLAVAAIVGLFFRDNDLIPWLVGGLGLAVGFMNIKAPEVRGFLIAGSALTLALMSIHGQPFNPIWLTGIVYYEKVFVTHVLLVVALVAFVHSAREGK